MKPKTLHLRIPYFIVLPTLLLLIILFESETIPTGLLASESSMDFVATTLLELFTLAAIPLALRWMRINAIRQRIQAVRQTDEKTRIHTYTPIAQIRSALLLIPMILNTIGYYLFLSVAFGYMAIIIFLCLPFTYPSQERIIEETTQD